MLNPEERALKGLLQFWSMLFLAMGIVVVFFPNLVIQFLNRVSLRFTPTLPLLPYSDERLWVVLAFSLFITLTFICYSAQDDLKRRRDLVQFLLVSKLISAIVFVLCLFFDRMSLAYLIAAIIDGGIFTLTSAYYSRVLKSSHLVL